jgi:hypothetical protein
MVISSAKATVLLGSLMMLGLPVPKQGSGPGSAGQATEVRPKPIRVTGCLQKGDEENEFVITNKAGKKYEITSKSVALTGHVGHTVTVKGSVVAEEKTENEAKEEKDEKGEKEEVQEHEGRHLQVTSLTMVSPKCK